MIVFEQYGEALAHQKIVPGATATAFGTNFTSYTEHYVAYTSGGTTAIVAGDWVVGATSAARARVLSVTLSTGTWAGGDAAGHFILNSVQGTFQAENLNVAGNGNLATIAAAPRVCMKDEYINKEFYQKNPVAALVSAVSQTALCDITGGKPDQTALVGQPLAAGSSWFINDSKAIRNFKGLDYTNGSATTLQATFYYK